MKLSLIIPTLNGSKTIGRLLNGLSSQTVPPEEIIVVDSGSEDGTVEIVRDFRIEPIIIKREEFNHGGTRNMAAGLAKGDILIFMTQDAIPAGNRLVESLILPLKRHKSEMFAINNEDFENSPFPGGRGAGGRGIIAASYARHIPKPDASPIERFARQYNYPECPIVKGKDDEPELGIKTYFFSNACSAVRRDAFKDVGGFPDNIPMNEDMLFSYRLINAGYRVAYVPEAGVYHSHNYPPLRQFKKYRAIGASISISGLHREVTPHGEGFKFFRRGIATLFRGGDICYIPLFFADSLCRFLGFRQGLRQRKEG